MGEIPAFNLEDSSPPNERVDSSVFFFQGVQHGWHGPRPSHRIEKGLGHHLQSRRLTHDALFLLGGRSNARTATGSRKTTISSGRGRRPVFQLSQYSTVTSIFG